MKILTFDTETTGLVEYRRDACDKTQPAPVSMGWVVANLATGEVTEQYRLVKVPDTVPWGEKAESIHKITRPMLESGGADFAVVQEDFYTALRSVDAAFAYNFPFDDLILRSAHCRAGGELLSTEDYFLKKRTVCAMQLAAQWLRVPQGHGGVRYLKLDQAYRRIMGVRFTGAHNALTDAKATLDIVVEVLKLSQPATAANIQYQPLCLPKRTTEPACVQHA